MQLVVFLLQGGSRRSYGLFLFSLQQHLNTRVTRLTNSEPV